MACVVPFMNRNVLIDKMYIFLIFYYLLYKLTIISKNKVWYKYKGKVMATSETKECFSFYSLLSVSIWF